jgi:hypothetical protein
LGSPDEEEFAAESPRGSGNRRRIAGERRERRKRKGKERETTARFTGEMNGRVSQFKQ